MSRARDDAEDVVVLAAAAGRSAATNGSSCNSRSVLARADRGQIGQVQRPVDQVDVVRLEAQRRAQEGHAPRPGRRAAISRRTALPRSRRRSSFWMVLSRSSASSSSMREVEVAGDAERAAADHAKPREQLAHVHRDQVFEQHERRTAARLEGRPADAPACRCARGTATGARRRAARSGLRGASDRAGTWHRRATDGLRAARDLALSSLLVLLQDDRQVQAAVAQDRERVPGSTASGVSTGQTSRENAAARRVFVLAPDELRGAQQADPRALVQIRARPRPARPGTAPRPWRGRAALIAASCSAAVRPSGGVSATLPDSCCFSPATRTMKNSSRFEDDDRQELQAFDQRHRRVARLVEHAPVELQPGQLAVDEQLRARQIRRRRAARPPGADERDGDEPSKSLGQSARGADPARQSFQDVRTPCRPRAPRAASVL